MHIVMTVNAAWNIRNFRLPLVTALLADGHRIRVLATPDESVAALRDLGCAFVPLEMNVKGLNPIEDIRLIARFRQLFADLRPDIVLSFTIKNNVFGAIAAKGLGLAFIPNVTGLGTAFLSGGVLQRIAEGLYRHAFARLPVIFFQNQDDRALFVARNLVAAQQPRLLPGSGIDLEQFAAVPLPEPSAPVTFLMIARLLRDKGVVEFVDAARQIKRSHAETCFQLLGAVSAQNRSAIALSVLEGWVAEGVVSYLGTTEDVRSPIAAAHVIVLPSYREGAPRTLIEGAAMARPVIATDVPGCRAVVEEGRTGFLCAPRSAQALAARMGQYLALSPEAQAEMGRAGRAKMEAEFDQAHVVQAYRRAISDVTGRKAGC
ncbi:MAG: glycosyltransferase family 4 protein [Roseinatronobacter sp.]|nr:glycosyltransferase family 4 protein [Roseinatronobacter sp.]